MLFKHSLHFDSTKTGLKPAMAMFLIMNQHIIKIFKPEGRGDSPVA